MNETHLDLNVEERALIVGVLQREWGETRVEYRRTDYSDDFRQQVRHKEDLLRGLLDKLGAPATAEEVQA